MGYEAESDRESIRADWDQKLESRNPGSSYWLVTSQDCLKSGWDRLIHGGPFTVKGEAVQAAKTWNDGAFSEECQGWQTTPYVEITTIGSK